MSTPFFLDSKSANDPIIQAAMSSFMQRLQKEEDYRAQVRAGLIQPQLTQVINISDRD
jgi:hypothetical protein